MNKKEQSVMTLRELKQAVCQKRKRRCPSANSVEAAGAKALSDREYADGSRLTAYETGYATYITGKRKTVVEIARCGDYSYFTSAGKIEIPEAQFLDMPWYVRVQMEAEDRLVHNQNTYANDRSNEQEKLHINEDEVADNSKSSIENIVEMKIQTKIVLSLLTEKQAKIVSLCYLEDIDRKTVAKLLGISVSAVSDAIRHSMKQLRKKLEENF